MDSSLFFKARCTKYFTFTTKNYFRVQTVLKVANGRYQGTVSFAFSIFHIRQLLLRVSFSEPITQECF